MTGQVSERAALAELSRRQCYGSLEAFAKLIWPVVNPNRELLWTWHMTATCRHLEAWLNGTIQRLIINMPPGHSKSFLVSLAAPCWAWLDRPHLRFIGASYDMALSNKLNIKRRTILDSTRYRVFLRPKWGKAKGQWGKILFCNDVEGFMRAASTSTGIMGDHCDFMIIDDPLKARDAWGPPLKGHVDWFKEDACTRFGDLVNACICLVMQRIHPEDLSGYFLKEEPERWEHFNLPTEFDPDNRCSTSIGWEDPRTEKGELLCPTRFPAEVLDSLKVTLGAASFAGQHNQDPTVGGGQMFNSSWWQKWTPDPEFGGLPGKVDQWVISIDAAFGESGKSAGDWNVTLVVARIGNKAYVITEARARAEFGEFLTFLFGELVADGERRAGGGFADRWKDVPFWRIERAANGAAIVSALKQRMPNSCDIRSVVPVDSKEARAATVAPLVESGHVLLPADAPWVDDFIEEASKFPNTSHNDRVDALTQALDFFGNSIGISAFRPELPKPPPAPTEASLMHRRWAQRGQSR